MRPIVKVVVVEEQKRQSPVNEITTKNTLIRMNALRMTKKTQKKYKYCQMAQINPCQSSLVKLSSDRFLPVFIAILYIKIFFNNVCGNFQWMIYFFANGYSYLGINQIITPKKVFENRL